MKVNLTSQQLEAIRSPLEPSLVLAGAGTGKTSVMAERVLWLIDKEKIEPNQILGLTFTNKAAIELRNRIRENLKKKIDYSLEPEVLTYHSFALRILNDYGLLIGLDSDLIPVSETTRVSLAYKTVINTKINLNFLDKSPKRIAQQIILLDNQMSEHDLDLEKIIQNAKELKNEIYLSKQTKILKDIDIVIEQRIELAKLVNEFRNNKQLEHVIDFADQMRFALQIVKTNDQVKDKLREEFKAVLLDEYQDTSVIQRLFLSEIFDKGHPVTAVGDPLQAIYGWRGASVANINNFQKHFPKDNNELSSIFKLTSNFRSGQNILNSANKISKDLREIHHEIDSLVSHKQTSSEVKIGLYDTYLAEAQGVVEEIEKLLTLKKVNFKDIAILGRSTPELLTIFDLLIKKKIPAIFSGKRNLLDIPEVSEVLAYLRILDDPSHNPSLVRILAGPRFELSPTDLNLLAKRAKELVKDFKEKKDRNFEDNLLHATDGIDIADLAVLADALKDPGNFLYSPGVKEELLKLDKELEILRRFITEPLSDFIFRIMSSTGLLSEILCGDDFTLESRYEALMQLQEVAESFDQGSPHAVVREFLEWIDEAEDLNTSIEFEQRTFQDCVQLMTIHSAKGLEFPYVFIPSVCETVFPNKRKDSWLKKAEVIPYNLRVDRDFLPTNFKSGSKELEIYKDEINDFLDLEERRLMYVALTRAEKGVFVSSHWWGKLQKNPRGPSKFLLELKQQVEDGNGLIINWSENLEQENPNLVNKQSVNWPFVYNVNKREIRKELAMWVKNNQEIDENQLSLEEKEILKNIDEDIEALLRVLQDKSLIKRNVKIPDYLNVTKTIKMIRNSKSFAENLVRPMPQKPIDQSRRGTQFHHWVEKHFAMPTLFDTLDLEGAADQSFIDDSKLDEMKSAFLNSSWATLKPVALEWPFEISIEGRSLRGRIDAVFEKDGEILLIDWKTGVIGKSDHLQLSWYRHAWWKYHKIDPNKLKAGFVYVPSMQFEAEKNVYAVDDEIFSFKKLDIA